LIPRYLTRQQIIDIHDKAIDSGGVRGILNEGMLDLALETPQSGYFGVERYRSLHQKAAALMHELLKLTPFVDGNKRTGLLAADVFLRENGYELSASEQDAIDTSLVISSCSMDIPGIAVWVENNSRRRRWTQETSRDPSSVT